MDSDVICPCCHPRPQWKFVSISMSLMEPLGSEAHNKLLLPFQIVDVLSNLDT